jgi:hypothetical protein
VRDRADDTGGTRPEQPRNERDSSTSQGVFDASIAISAAEQSRRIANEVRPRCETQRVRPEAALPIGEARERQRYSGGTVQQSNPTFNQLHCRLLRDEHLLYRRIFQEGDCDEYTFSE